jgi:hypothetical protein
MSNPISQTSIVLYPQLLPLNANNKVRSSIDYCTPKYGYSGTGTQVLKYPPLSAASSNITRSLRKECRVLMFNCTVPVTITRSTTITAKDVGRSCALLLHVLQNKTRKSFAPSPSSLSHRDPTTYSCLTDPRFKRFTYLQQQNPPLRPDSRCSNHSSSSRHSHSSKNHFNRHPTQIKVQCNISSRSRNFKSSISRLLLHRNPTISTINNSNNLCMRLRNQYKQWRPISKITHQQCSSLRLQIHRDSVRRIALRLLRFRNRVSTTPRCLLCSDNRHRPMVFWNNRMQC